MASSTEPRSGIKYGWTLGENNWNTDMDANLLHLGRFATHLSVKDRNLATPPGSPVTGDTYIVAATPTGAWVAHTGHVAIWSGSAWIFGIPRIGWLAYIEDEEKLSVYKAAGWSVGIAI